MSPLEKRIKNLSRGLSLSVTKLAKDIAPRYVHRLRTTIRRIEALVASAPLDLSKKQQGSLKKLAALRKRAGRVRDLDVQLDLLGAIANGSTATDKSMLAELLQQKREKHAERLKRGIEQYRTPKFSSHVKSVFRKAAEASQGQGPAEALRRAKEQLAALGAEFEDHQALKPSLLHEVRIKLKGIRYLGELGEESEEQQRFLGEMKNVQDALGAWHDWEELTKTADKQFGDRANCPLLLEIRALFGARQSAARAAALQLFARNIRKQPRTASVRVLAKRA
jgi:CHAD domain-containing protein